MNLPFRLGRSIAYRTHFVYLWQWSRRRFDRMLEVVRGLDISTGVPLSELGLDPRRSVEYANYGDRGLIRILRGLDIRLTDSAIDLGCGKAGPLIAMSRFPFARVDGVEIAAQLAEIARSNIRRMGIWNSTIFVGDASEFEAFDNYTFVYMYNPFKESVMVKVIDNLRMSLLRHPRKCTLIYRNALCERQILGLFSPVPISEITFWNVGEIRVYQYDPHDQPRGMP